MAQDVQSGGIMGDDPLPLSKDGYLKVDTNVKEIIYHPTLNVILICTGEGLVRVLDVNSGVILQSTNLSAENAKQIKCRYIPTEDRVLFCDGQAIGVRSDYNGVLLLDSVLQKTLSNEKETVKIEMLLTEAEIFKQSLSSKPFDHVSAYATQILEQLQNVVGQDQSSHKKGIKAQKWNTVCISVPVFDLKRATGIMVSELVTRKVHSTELQIASALKERISELLGEQTNASDRKMMASEARRRESFSQWPHMDYKWALPERMAQAGFYHQPNSSGDDRAMCFTCSVCLVSWERSDEPWGEHERHSPNCPYVLGEYTQNVPISVTNATGPAIDATFRGGTLDILGASSVGKLLPTCSRDGLISVYDVSRKIKRTHSFLVTHFDSHILERITQDFDVPGFWNDDDKRSVKKQVTALAIVSDKAAKEKAIAKPIRPTIVSGITISQGPIKPAHPDNVDPTSESYQTSILDYCMQITDPEGNSSNRNLYLVVYDFTYSKEQEEPKVEDQDNKENEMGNQLVDDLMVDQITNIIEYISPPETTNNEEFSLIQELTSSFYKNLIPGDIDTVFLPPMCPTSKKKNHSGPRLITVDVNNTESDATAASSNILASLTNGHFTSEPNEPSTISDHIVELKNNQSNKKLNYSRAVQCISLPDVCKSYPNMEIVSILPTHDDGHILVTVSSTCCLSKSFLLVYSLDFTNKMVKINEKSVVVKELGLIEQPVEIKLLPVKISSKVGSSGVEGHAVLVCMDGAVRIVDLATMKTSCIAEIDGEYFVSAAYCNSLDRLCASTVKGSLHFFVLNDCDNDLADDHEEYDLFGVNIDNSIRELSSMDKLESIRCFKEPPISIALEDLRTMQKLTHFSPSNFPYNVVVPPCWSEFQQAMRQRRSTLVVNTEAYTKTWRLQTGTTTWEEHIFEITLPTAVVLGHVDVHFTLQPGCTKPCVEISLLRQNKNGIGHNKDVKFSVDDTVTIDMLRRVENPVVSEEYLRAHNADILAGPVNIAHRLDLTEQSGTVTLSSPKMFKVKVRNLLLHVRAVYDKNDKKFKRQESTSNIKLDKAGVRKYEQYLGCDSIHELSIAVYTPTSNAQISHERALRNLMLDSNVFVQSLITTAVGNSNPEILNNVLDILNWIAAIRLVPNRGNNGEAPNDQLEFMFINGIEDNMTGLLRQCLLLANRSIAHKCMNYVMTCCSGAKNINKSIGDHFNTSVLNSLLIIIEQIKQVKSAAGLHLLFALLLKVVKKDTEQSVTSKCVTLLKEVSDDLLKRSNPYHLLLRSRYGLYGLPTEPELFDIDPPPFVKGSSSSFYTFSSIHTHANSAVPNDSSSVVTLAPDTHIPQNKENIFKEPIVTDNKLKYKNVACPKVVIGLIETEPLHVTCLSTSEGTRLEMADVVNANAVNTNVQNTVSNMPLQLAKFYSLVPGTPNKKEDLQQFITKYMEKNQSVASHLSDLLGPGSISSNLKLDNFIEEAEQALDFKMDPIALVDFDDAVPVVKCTTSQGISQISSQATMGSLSRSSVNFNHNLPWQQLLVPPPKQVIVIERMHSSARRYVTLDFGEPVSLTDILIPSCADLVSLTIDVWYCGEELDAVRLVTALDIGTNNLIMNNLQPPPLCKYMKITLVARQGMTTTRCRIPLGYFYGHVVILPEEIPNDINIKPPVTDYEKNLTVLSKLLEDISCRYSLACSKLKDYLQPFLVADMKNTIHLSAYINILKNKGLNVTNPEHNKILTAYHETLAYQHQLNTIRNVMSRIEASLPGAEPPNQMFKVVSTDKLNSIAETLLEVLLSIDKPAEITEELCQQFFEGLCVSQSSRLQLLAAVVLEKSCGSSEFWGDFLSNTLVKLYSTSCTAIFPQDRLFVLLIYLSRKSPERSAVIDAAMRVVYDTLKPLEANRSLLLAVNVDLPLLSWLLMYLSLQLTFSKNQNDRWDWVLGEMVGKSNYNDSEQNKLTKQYHTTIWQKGPWCITKEFNPKALKGMMPKKCPRVNVDAGKSIEEHSDPTSLRDLMMVPQKKPQFIDTTHCLAVSKILLKFIISMDHSGSADMMLLAFKIISRLVTMAKLQLCQLLSENQLLELINFSLACKVPWAPFAVSCFLQDALDLPADVHPEVNETDTAMDIVWSPIISQNEVNVENESPENSMVFMLEEQDQSKTKMNMMSKINLPFSALPSVYETDSNDSDIDEMLEAFEKVKYSTQAGNSAANAKATPEARAQNSTTSANSPTIDARIETGVYSSSEIALRKLANRNTQKLLQNISSEKFKPCENPLAPWPEPLGPFHQESNLKNLQMLSFCFDELFSQMQTMSPSKIENVLHLWLTLNSTRKDEKFDSSTMPVVLITVDAVNALISALAWVPGLSLTTWCLGLQTLTLVCNTNNSRIRITSFDLSGMSNAIVNHRDFVQMFISLLSGNGIAFTNKNEVGPTLCKALHDFLVRLQVRCDVVSPNSKLGNLFKRLLLHVVYELSKPGGSIATRTGHLDAQCKLLLSIQYLDFSNIDISIGMSTLECTSALLNSYFMNVDNIKCMAWDQKNCTVNLGHLFSPVLGGNESNKQDRPIAYEDLLINLLKLLAKLVQTPISDTNSNNAPMDTDHSATSQTDESKAEQIQQMSTTAPCFADTVLQHHPTVVALCKCLASCKMSSLCMINNVSQQSGRPAFSNFAEPTSVGDAVFHILSILAKKASRKELILTPLLQFLSQTPQLSEPLVWFIFQVLDDQEALKLFYNADGISILARSIVSSSNTPSTISRNGTISTVMQHFNGVANHNDVHVPLVVSSANKALQSSVENHGLINYAPLCTITCQSVTSQPPDVLTQGVTGVTHRRARSPLWSYNYYQEETYTELLLQLPHAILLKEVQLQPHTLGLSTCPSFVAFETSATGPSGLVPACHPLPSSGLTFIRINLPTAKVVNCVLIRLYKPKVGNSIGLLQIRLLGASVFGKNAASCEYEEESYCNHSLGWLRLLHHCFTMVLPDAELHRHIVTKASEVPNLLNTCCGLLLVPSYITPVYLPCLEKLLRKLALLSPENGIETIRILLDNRLSIVAPMMSLDNTWQDRLMINVSGYQSACELLYQICEHQDANTSCRVKLILEWLEAIANECLATGNTSKCSAAYVSSIASILWYSNQAQVTYDLKSLITLQFFETIYMLKMKASNNSLRYALDSLLCSLCYNRSELFPLLLQKIGVLVPNLSSISDDCKGMTDDRKQDFANSEWYSHLIIGELSELNLNQEQLETVALASRSPTAIQQLLDSGLPKLLNSAICEFCNNNKQLPMAKLEKVTIILQFFTDVCDEKMLRDWLGSQDGSSFWPRLLHWLCKKPYNSSSIQSEAHVHLEEVCIKFLAKCCLCHPKNQVRLATVLCEVITLQQNGISGFLRRLILQLLLENEKVPVSIEADEIYKFSRVGQVYIPAHPAFKQTYNRTMLYLSTTTTLGEILEQHLWFNAVYKTAEAIRKLPASPVTISKRNAAQIKDLFGAQDLSDLSVAAGVTAKDKRAKDIKNYATSTPQSKKKRYAAETSCSHDPSDGRIVKCLSYSQDPLPLNMNLGQLLRLVEAGSGTNDWPYIHLSICQGRITDDKNHTAHQPISSALQVFSSLGGLALLAQHLPPIYPEAFQISTHEKSTSDQSDSDWIKLEEPDDICESMEETMSNNSPKCSGSISHIPPHSLTAFGLFLRLPGYAEVLLKDTKRALCLLRLMLGVTDDGEGGDIFLSSVATTLPTLPFEMLQRLYDSSPLCSDDGRLLRKTSISTGVVQLLLACLGILTHHSTSMGEKDPQKEAKAKEERQLYWAKGTGFGTGSTQQSWNVEQALMKQKNEEEHVTVLLQVLASFINPNDEPHDEGIGSVLPSQFSDLLAKSSLLPAICSYLRNDSVLDMARHIPLYKAILKILRALAVSSQLVQLLLPQKSKSGETSVCSLLKNMKRCVDTYASKLQTQKSKGEKNGKGKSPLLIDKMEESEQGEGLATLMPDIQNTAGLVATVTFGMVDESDLDMENSMDRLSVVSPEEQYLRIMKNLQFAAHDMIEEQQDGLIKFMISHHFESMVLSTSEQSHPSRVKRIAQETVTLSTSLPLSYSSSVFVRYDSSRLDVMKVLITGPADTPYANGCFELDVFFPPDYPVSPMLINLETTGHHTVRFNPNLYNDGKVCLSVLNTWHGRPEEKWNSQTSSFLQVLVSIQSLILVPEPYFNEPGYERARGTPGWYCQFQRLQPQHLSGHGAVGDVGPNTESLSVLQGRDTRAFLHEAARDSESSGKVDTRAGDRDKKGEKDQQEREKKSKFFVGEFQEDL
ncbi:unnamed protein product [Ceutorhynchus assimilis]|uniref:UBC core domain-containing protein n=1 Tax=Ceutorhynchus assimilis TaxID=467358 RepID=A0A9P0DMB5_9CUCU|nr:unnamed protein product [Ceutorhynchus assimilis]